MDLSKFSIDVDTLQESHTRGQEVLTAVKNPSWAIAFLIHVLLILILAFWLLPGVGNSIGVFLEQSESVELKELEPVNTLEFEVEDPAMSSTVLPNRNEIEVDLETLDDADTFVKLELSPEAIDALIVEQENPFAAFDVDTSDGFDGKVNAIKRRVAEAGGDAGEVQFSLSWGTTTDLDLHVITPDGERISYLSRRSNCNGVLDVDRNAREAKLTTEPVENVRWIKDPLPGRYTVIVHQFRRRGGNRETPYELMAKTGDDVTLKTAAASWGGQQATPFRFVYFAPSMSEQSRVKKLEAWKQLQEQEEATASRQLAAIEVGSRNEDRMLWQIVQQFPHTDAAIKAWMRIPGTRGK